MKINSTFTLVIALIVVVFISATCIVPIVQAAQSEQITEFNNEGLYFNAIYAEDDVTHTISVTTSADGNSLVVDGETVVVRSNNYYRICSGNTFAVALETNGNLTVAITGSSNVTITANTDSLLLDEGKLYRVTTGATTEIGSYDVALIPYKVGDMGITASSNTYYANTDAVMYISISATRINSGWAAGNAIVGFTKDGVVSVEATYTVTGDTTVYEYNDITGLSVTLSNVNVIDEYHYRFGAQATFNSTSGSEYASNIFIPIEYSYVTQSNDMVIAMLGIIPVLIFVVPIMLIVRSFGMGRD